MSFFANFLSGASGLVSFASNTISSIQNAGASIESLAGNIGNALAKIPSEIVSAISNVGQGILYGLSIIGSFFQTAFHDLSSALYGGLQRIEHAFNYIGKSLYSMGVYLADQIVQATQWLRKGAIDVVNTIVNIFLQIGQAVLPLVVDFINFSSEVYNGLVKFGQDIMNFFSSLASDFTPITGFFENAFGQLVDLPQLPVNLAKQEASRVASAFPKVVGFNTSMEIIKSISRYIGAETSLKRMVGKALLGPFLGSLGGVITELIMQAFYPQTTTSSVYQANIQKSVPNPTTPLSTSLSLPSSSTNKTIQPPSITTSEPEPVPPSTTMPTGSQVIAVTIDDAMNMLTQITSAYEGGVQIANLQQSLVDNLGISASIVPSLLGLYSLVASDSTSPTLTIESLIGQESPSDILSMNVDVNVSLIDLPQGLYICQQLSTNEQTQYTSPSTVSDTIAVDYSTCLPLTGGAFDQVNGEIFTEPVPSDNAIQDQVSNTIQYGVVPSQNATQDQVSNTINYGLPNLVGITPGTTYTVGNYSTIIIDAEQFNLDIEISGGGYA